MKLQLVVVAAWVGSSHRAPCADWAKPDELGVVEKLADRRTDLAKQFPGVAILRGTREGDGAVVR